jgi:hypothetical protein
MHGEGQNPMESANAGAGKMEVAQPLLRGHLSQSYLKK